MTRRHNFQTVSWFFDLVNRKLLNLDPPYQRRSVWSQEFKDYFVDTVMLNYPAPALFVYEDITADGRSVYHVVDGKQRLTTLFDFVNGRFPISEKLNSAEQGGKYFSSLDDATKKAFWSYQFLVEYVPSEDPRVINGIFDRINRNVAKLTPQELRHAKLDGLFIKTAENLAAWMIETLPRNFPRFAAMSRNQMKDVEFVAILLLLLEEGAKGYSQDGLDAAFTDRDQVWDEQANVDAAFRAVILCIQGILSSSDQAPELLGTRFRNQADFYSLVGATSILQREGFVIDPKKAVAQLSSFVADVEDEQKRSTSPELASYFDAARSASNDKGPRETRIRVIRSVLSA
jgi:hypothetical protein